MRDKKEPTSSWISDAPLVTTPDHEAPNANRRIELYRGRFQIIRGGVSTTEKGSVVLEWLPTPGITFSFKPTTAAALNQYHTGTDVELSIPKHRLRGPAFVTNWGSAGVRAVCSDSVEGITSKSRDPSISSLIFHVPNLRRVDGTAVRSGRAVHFARYECNSPEWRLTLDPAPHMDKNIEQLKARGGYAFTYTGLIARTDGRSFRIKHAIKLLERLHVFLSFCAGRWTSPMLVGARTEYGATIWRQWTVWKSSPFKSVQSWLPLQSGPKGVFPGFMEIARNDEQFSALAAAIHWYVEANEQAGGVDGALILAQTALELLAWQKLVVGDDLVDESAFRDMTAYSKIRMLLRQCGIPIAIPQHLMPAARAAEYGPKDAVGLVTSIRNDTVHPPNKRAYVRPAGEAIIAAWKLSLWYVELVILRMCGHVGKYHDRTAVTGSVRDEVAVPWTAG